MPSLGNEDRNAAIVHGLRRMADFIEEHPNMTPFRVRCDEWVYGDTPKEDMAVYVRSFGDCSKNYIGDMLEVTKAFAKIASGSPVVYYELNVTREAVCTKRVVGQREREVSDYSNLPKKLITEDIIEYDCDPILKPTD